MFFNFSPDTDDGTVFDGCPPGSMMCNGVCVGVGAPTAERPNPFVCPDDKVTTTTSTISPALILAAAAAFFFAG